MRSQLVRLLSPRVFSAARIPFRSALPPARPHVRITPLQSPLCRWSSSHPPFADPSRPDLFYHLLDDPNPSVYALSFLSSPPLSPRSATILGWLPAVTEATTEDVDAGLNDFVENRASVPYIHVQNVAHQHLLSTLPSPSARSSPRSTTRGCR